MASTAGLVVARQERIPTAQSMPFVARLGIEAAGLIDSRPDAGPPQDKEKRLMRFAAQVLLACLAALAAGCEHAPGYPPSPIARPTEVTDFATLYSENCAACHGANGAERPGDRSRQSRNIRRLSTMPRCANGSPAECPAPRCRPSRNRRAAC